MKYKQIWKTAASCLVAALMFPSCSDDEGGGGDVQDDRYRTLMITLEAMPPVEEIAALPGVAGVDELGGPRYRVQFSDAREAMDKIVEASYKNGWQLSELRQEKSSLDTIIAELSKK